jgi:lysophospholipase L1-like esterase
MSTSLCATRNCVGTVLAVGLLLFGCPTVQSQTNTNPWLFVSSPNQFNQDRQGITNVGTSEWLSATGLTGSGGDILALDGNIATQSDDLGNDVVSNIAALAAYQQDGGLDGVVSVEAENAYENTAQGSHNWVPVNEGMYSGATALQALPNNGTNLDSGYVTNSPRLDYRVNFVHTGTHYVWVRGVGAASTDDSLHAGLDGAAVTTADRITGLGSAVGWTQETMDGVVATIEVATPGEHTLNVWMREDGTVVDKIVLSVNPAYRPSGMGPAESPITASTVLLEDDFDDGDMVGWTIVDNCPFSQPEWSVQANVLMQTNNCFGFSPDGIALGTHHLSASTLPNDIDIQVQLRSQDPLLDPVPSNDASNLKFGTIGMIFGFQDENNYYRFELNARNGYRKLWRIQAGTFTELVTSPQSYVGGQWINLRIIHQNGVILIFIDGTQVMATEDATYSSGKIAFFCAVNPSCSFDNLMVTTAPSDDPMPGLNLPDSSSHAHASGEYFVTPGNTLDVAGMTTVATGIGGMEFVLDEGTGNEVSQTDFNPPYSSQFSAFVPGEHAITAYLLDTSSVRLTSGSASVIMPRLGMEGIHLYAMGDSITFGLFDNIAADDISIDTRNTGGGYTPVLNDYLSVYNDDIPITVINDGNSGELTSTGAGRIGMVLARTPAAQAYLIGYGTNDSGGSMPLMSGLGMIPGDAGYAGTYKDYLQQIIDAVVPPPPTGAGKLVFFAKIPPYLSNSTRDAKIQEYNQVIDELVTQLKNDYPSSYLSYTPPDFHSYFMANPVEMASDLIHPNGSGYQSMGRLWCEALNGLQGWICLDDDEDGLLNSLEAQLGTDPLLADTDGDGLVDGSDGVVPIGIIPGGVDTNGDGFVDGEQVFATDPLLADSDGDRLDDGLEVANTSDPLDANSWPVLADGDIAPLGAPDGQINAGDIQVATRIVLGLEVATTLELAHSDLYPPGAPDGMINLQDLILLMKMP